MKKQSLKSMAFIFTILTLMLLLKDIGNAQRMRMSVDDRVKQLSEQLTLTKVQADSVRKIYEASDKERGKLFENMGENRGAMRDSMQSIMKRYDAKIESLLTVSQRSKFDTVKTERSRMMRQQGERRRPQE